MRSHASHELAQALGGTVADSEGWSGGIWNTFIMSVQRNIALCTIFYVVGETFKRRQKCVPMVASATKSRPQID
jgi:hypothetical protein